MESCTENYLITGEEYIDPELEKTLQAALDREKIDYIKLAEDLAAKVDHIHSSYLFVEAEGRKILRALCKVISSTPTSIRYNSWKDLAAVLRLDSHEIGCIEQCKQDYTELVLLTFSQNPDAALSDLVMAFQAIQRYDALGIAAQTFPALCKCVEAQSGQMHKYTQIQVHNRNKVNWTRDEVVKKRLLKPESLSFVKSVLPFVLRNDETDTSYLKKEMDVEGLVQDSGLEHIKRRVDILTDASVPRHDSLQPTKMKKKLPLAKSVMLTFADDGLETAQLIQSEFSKKREGLEPMRVLILDQHADKVLQNPHRFITHQFVKMDYIIPIVTRGYLDILCNKTDPSVLNSLDSRYIQLIHDLMSKYYTDNHCINDKFRSVIPRGSSVTDHPHFKIDPVFKAYEYDVQTLTLRLAKAKKKT